MTTKRVHIRELAGWDLDDYQYRPLINGDKLLRARAFLQHRPAFTQLDPVCASESHQLKDLLEPHASRSDLLEEMSGLSWTLGIVDLRSLIAFQRRLYFPQEISHPLPPAAGDWPALIEHSFGTVKPPEFDKTHDPSRNTLVLRSDNPNTHIRMTNDATFPITVHTGSPFFEVASYAGRWFLRDGYHRAYSLLKADIHHVPAVIINAETIEQVGANQPWFFPEKILFSQAPPLVTDFLEDDLVNEYDRPRLIRTLRLTIEDTLVPESKAGE
ncbi:hypothetical protein [Terriglobus albidus]|uniref:hypothetical protein n=1 Tax=Terriglobus albidus TaxID=1592106 RepID=UPI0021E0253E|nr:hypothetical protein [Terriglobus albidus]